METLSPLFEEHLPAILAWRNHPAIRKNMFNQDPISPAEHRGWFERLRTDSSRKVLVFSNDGVACGVVSFTEINTRHGHAFLGFYAAPEAPAGCGLLIMRAALAHAFETLLLRKLSGEVLAFNKGVISMHKLIGYHHEGTFIRHIRDGVTFHDVHRFALFSSDWEAAKARLASWAGVR